MNKTIALFLKCLLVCLFVFSLGITSASALEWDGAASSGGVGESGATGAFEVGWLDSAKAVGYRFSVVNV